MSKRVTVSFDSTWLIGLDNTTEIATSLTEKECAALLQMAHFLLERKLWQDLTDSEWQELYLLVATAISKLTAI